MAPRTRCVHSHAYSDAEEGRRKEGMNACERNGLKCGKNVKRQLMLQLAADRLLLRLTGAPSQVASFDAVTRSSMDLPGAQRDNVMWSCLRSLEGCLSVTSPSSTASIKCLFFTLTILKQSQHSSSSFPNNSLAHADRFNYPRHSRPSCFLSFLHHQIILHPRRMACWLRM